MNNKANWIWKDNNNLEDEYVQFIGEFTYVEGKCFINLCCDSNFTVWINGKMAGFGKYADYPFYRVEEEIEITKYCKSGLNKVAILVWYVGVDSSVYCKGDAGLIFSVETDKDTLLISDKNIYCRLAPDYINYKKQNITAQLGIGYSYNCVNFDNWYLENYNKNNFILSTEKVLPKIFYKRQINRLKLCERANSHIVSQGTFLCDKGINSAQAMLYAGMFFIPPSEIGVLNNNFSSPIIIKNNKNDGVYIILDMQSELSGFLDVDFDVKEECSVYVAYGEHLIDGRVRSYIDGRCFSTTLFAKIGSNQFLNTFRRFGCRYLQLFFFTDEVKLNYIGIRNVEYEINSKIKKFKNIAIKEIYMASINTLKVCMHEHYEDTPWREQALYTMDSRNQMLFGYIAFKEYKFAKASLELIGKSVRKDKLLALTSPSGTDYPIPYFSLMYIVQMLEYAINSKDCALLHQNYQILSDILEVFIKKIKSNGLIDNFIDKSYWNFYEWTDKLDGNATINGNVASFDCCLNAFFLLALNSMKKICKLLSKNKLGKYYNSIYKKILVSINNNFYDNKNNLYFSFIGKNENHYSELVNSLLVLTNVADRKKSNYICEQLIKNKDNIMSKISLSHSIFKYDALIKNNKRKYKKYILQEIDNKYFSMLKKDSTTFWETELGDKDFYRAGSLSHGWSALPIYIYYKYKLIKG